MKKYKEWLRNEIKNLQVYTNNPTFGRFDQIRLWDVEKLIDQMDEPEVLSQEWIDEYRKTYTMEDSVEISDLQNLLVPKQEEVDRAYKDGYEKGREHGFYKGYREGLGYKGSEPETSSQGENINIVLDDLKEYIKEQQSLSQNVGLAHTPAGNDTHYRQYDYVLECINEYEPSDDLQNLIIPKQDLPVIPKFVAEWIAKHRDTFDLYPALKKLEDKPAAWKPWKRIYEWYRMNTHQFVNAYLTGEYEVEEEQKYYVIFPSVDENGKGFNYLAKDTCHNELWIEDSRTDGLDWEERSSFTEDEIRDLDKGDILFEQFAVKVEELEE